MVKNDDRLAEEVLKKITEKLKTYGDYKSNIEPNIFIIQKCMWEAIKLAIEAGRQEVFSDKITRFEVIDKNGRAYSKWNCKVNPMVQDEGRTLKIFVKALKKGEKP